MATSPQRSDYPLHKFSLLKWGKKSHVNSLQHTRHRPTDFPPPPRTTALYHDRRITRRRSPTSSPLESREILHEFAEGGVIERRSPLTARKRFSKVEDGRVEEDTAEAEGRVEELRKLWNLRPRKTPASKNGHQIGLNGGGSIGASSEIMIDAHVNKSGFQETVTTKSLRLRCTPDVGVEKKEKAKLRISLPKEEIEEDIFIITGSRPARRPKRRPKIVQKQLDVVFPGLSLLGATADSFKIHA